MIPITSSFNCLKSLLKAQKANNIYGPTIKKEAREHKIYDRVQSKDIERG